jgi:hypothetical protein
LIVLHVHTNDGLPQMDLQQQAIITTSFTRLLPLL